MECSPQDEQPVSISVSAKQSQDESGDMESSRQDGQHRNKEFIQGIEDAFIKSGKVDKRMAQFMFVGPPESGKSSLMDRLLGRPRKNFSLSTGVSSSIIIVDIDEINQTTFYSATTEEDSDIWKEIEHEASFVSQMAPGSIVVPPQSEQDTTKSPKVQSESQTSTQSIPSESIASHGRVPSESIESVKIESISSKLPSSVVSILEKYSHKIQKKKCSLYFRDTGGQVEFQEMLAVVIFGPSLFFFVFNLDLDFKSKFTIQYRSSTSESTNCYTSSITTEDALLQCLASVYAMDTSDDGSVKTHKPLVIIVGTHKDKLGSVADSKITQLNRDLDSLIKRNGFESLVQYADESKGQVMYAVDNTSDSEEDFKRIRSKVNSLVNIRKEFSIEYPISYLLFCLDLQNIEKSVLSLDECKVLAARYGIKGDNVFHLLHFLHIRTGVILHFNVEGLSHIIVKEPQVLFDKLTTLIVETFSSKSLTSEEMRSFKTKGILAASAFEDITSSDDKIGHKEFLQLLVHLRIITPFTTTDNQEERYFIPCVLNHLNESHEDDLETGILPLAFKFQCHHPPKGLFGVLIIRLITSKSKIEFHLLQDKIYKDQVILEVGEDHDEISFKLKPSHLEVKFFPAKSSSDLRVHSVSEVCNAVRESIAECINQSIEDLHYSKAKVGAEACFKCDTCPELHPVKNETLYCPRKKKKSHIPEDEMYWFNKVTCTQKVLPLDQLTSRKRTLDEDDPLQPPLKRISMSTTLEEHQSDSDGGIQGVEVIHVIEVEVTNSSQFFEWKGYGLRLDVPPKSLPSHVSSCTIVISASLSGHYSFPKNNELVSSVFWLKCTPSCEFQVPLSLQIEHCAPLENSSQLSVVRASCAQKELPYSFKVVQGGSFSEHSSYGFIPLKRFSGVAVVQEGSDKRRYWSSVFYMGRPTNRDIHFAVTWHDDAHITTVKKQYSSKNASNGPEQFLSFKDDTNTIKFSINEDIHIHIKDKWRIYPTVPPEISKKDVDQHRPETQAVPHCEWKATWMKKSEQRVEHLICRIDIEGTLIKNFFTFDIDPDSSSDNDLLDSKKPAAQLSASSKTQIDALTIADHYYITRYLRSLNSEALVSLGLALGLLYPSLQGMNSTPGGLPNDMIAAWLRKDSNVTEPPTWTSLAAALEKNDHNGLASDIRRDHLPCQAI